VREGSGAARRRVASRPALAPRSLLLAWHRRSAASADPLIPSARQGQVAVDVETARVGGRDRRPDRGRGRADPGDGDRRRLAGRGRRTIRRLLQRREDPPPASVGATASSVSACRLTSAFYEITATWGALTGKTTQRVNRRSTTPYQAARGRPTRFRSTMRGEHRPRGYGSPRVTTLNPKVEGSNPSRPIAA
jgi:hypothetical protein